MFQIKNQSTNIFLLVFDKADKKDLIKKNNNKIIIKIKYKYQIYRHLSGIIKLAVVFFCYQNLI